MGFCFSSTLVDSSVCTSCQSSCPLPGDVITGSFLSSTLFDSSSCLPEGITAGSFCSVLSCLRCFPLLVTASCFVVFALPLDSCLRCFPLVVTASCFVVFASPLDSCSASTSISVERNDSPF